jgi:hypothetical protein
VTKKRGAVVVVVFVAIIAGLLAGLPDERHAQPRKLAALSMPRLQLATNMLLLLLLLLFWNESFPLYIVLFVSIGDERA